MSGIKVCIVGSGVVGLNTALEVQRQFPSAKVTIIADKFNTETTSDGAAGLFEPFQSFLGPDIDTTKQWIKESYAFYDNLRKTEDCNIISISGYNFSNHSQEIAENKYMKLVSSDYRKVTKEELEQFNGKVKYGCYFTTLVIPCRKLLPLLTKKITENGGEIKKDTIQNLGQLQIDFDVVFNCTGLGAKFLCNDIHVVPIRGQIVQVKAPWVKHFYCFEFTTYIIPCGYDNIVTLGGTQDYGNFLTTVDDYITGSIKHRCQQLLPDLKTAPFVRNWVGLRPFRAQVRVEQEKINNRFTIVHNYGHGGFGVTSAPGTAKYAVQLFKENHQASGRCKY